MVDRFQLMVDRFIYQPLIEIYQRLIFFINGMLFDNYLLRVFEQRNQTTFSSFFRFTPVTSKEYFTDQFTGMHRYDYVYN